MKKMLCMGIALIIGAVSSVNAATVTNIITETFGSPAIDPALTVVNTVTISGGVADLDGVSGGMNFLHGGLTNFVMEAVLTDMGTTPDSLDTIFSFGKVMGLRWIGSSWQLFLVGGISVSAPLAGDHVAIVYVLDGGGSAGVDQIQYWVNGTMLDSYPRTRPGVSTLAAFGLEVAIGGRGFNGDFGAVAYSTFSGTWTSSDFALYPITSNDPHLVLNTKFVEKFDDAILVPELTAINGALDGISNGIAHLDGINQGFWFSDADELGKFYKPNTNFIMEAIVTDVGTTPSANDVLFSFNGVSGVRYDGSAWTMNWASSKFVVETPSDGDHVAWVYFYNAEGNCTVQYWLNGVLNAVGSRGDTNGNSAKAAFGFETYSSVFGQRGFNGSFDAVAYSTFSGTFSGGTEFALLYGPPAGTIILIQ